VALVTDRGYFEECFGCIKLKRNPNVVKRIDDAESLVRNLHLPL
jgi:hypothetical protein